LIHLFCEPPTVSVNIDHQPQTTAGVDYFTEVGSKERLSTADAHPQSAQMLELTCDLDDLAGIHLLSCDFRETAIRAS
jgi:hypothetical protein